MLVDKIDASRYSEYQYSPKYNEISVKKVIIHNEQIPS